MSLPHEINVDALLNTRSLTAAVCPARRVETWVTTYGAAVRARQRQLGVVGLQQAQGTGHELCNARGGVLMSADGSPPLPRPGPSFTDCVFVIPLGCVSRDGAQARRFSGGSVPDHLARAQIPFQHPGSKHERLMSEACSASKQRGVNETESSLDRWGSKPNHRISKTASQPTVQLSGTLPRSLLN